MSRIIVAGAGIGGLTAAAKLAEAGFSVEVYESKSRETAAYDWHDDVERGVFSECGIELPEEHFEKANWSFYGVTAEKCLNVHQPDGARDYSVERRPLHRIMTEYAEESGAKVIFERSVDGLIFEDGKVKGVIIGGEKHYCDLVIDSTGCCSNLRASLPAESGIIDQPRSGELFFAYRAFFDRKEGVSLPAETNKAFLRYGGAEGISWCIIDPSGTVNVLIGQIDGLDESTKDEQLQKLKKDNPIIGDKIVRGGQICRIPVRFPLPKAYYEGYLAIGDAAFMTIPMLGSGIASSIRAATLLSETLKENRSLTAENLWRYQVKVFKTFGAEHIGVDVLKRWLLGAEPRDVKYIFNAGLLSEDDLDRSARGKLIRLTPKSLLQKAVRGYARPIFILKLGLLLLKVFKAKRIGLKIPEVYDENAISNWQYNIEKLFC